jgi:magnesium-transporting ATPase (P-type)
LVVFAVITAGHLRIRHETGARTWLLLTALISTAAVLVTFVFTTLIHDIPSMVALLVIVALSMTLDFLWKRSRAAHPAGT